ncbi:cysteine desulfurase family protein [Clostridium taeniosporum]|uniref:cysteine desulfurase n=1 Tax=Clostridium taeniosporum TaxID=394958 RepID=A0A1D7XHY3_9CLOT|nr:cysteine desulfurase family protein [Clostridium taeniosporum]AOR22955.1 cysteine desulfurase [Clostridium taeniosporum]
MEVYLDHAATTPINKAVLEKMLNYLSREFGNPSSIYKSGRNAKLAIEDARNKIAAALKCKCDEIFFTSCATESNNWAIKGCAFNNKDKGNHIITTSIEHESVLKTCSYLEKNGFDVTYLPVDEYGLISIEDLKSAITDKTILISIMFANNEIGTIEPIKEIGEIARKNNIIFHTDAVQAIGKIPIDLKEYNIDLLTLSAHKINGPKGIGALFIRQGLEIETFMHGGSQEKGLRAGTENVAACVGLGVAIEMAMDDIEKRVIKVEKIRNKIINDIYLNIPCCKLNGHSIKRLSNNINFSFTDVNGKILVYMLDKVGIKASSGSACSCGTTKTSHVLLAIGLPEKLATESIRFTIDENITEEEINYFIKNLIFIVDNLRNHNDFSR